MRSMKRPSRRLRESVATMLKNGRFLAPPRAKRITTIMNSKKCSKTEKAVNYSASRPKTATLLNQGGAESVVKSSNYGGLQRPVRSPRNLLQPPAYGTLRPAPDQDWR